MFHLLCAAGQATNFRGRPVAPAELGADERNLVAAAGLVQIGRKELAGKIGGFDGVAVTRLADGAAPLGLDSETRPRGGAPPASGRNKRREWAWPGSAGRAAGNARRAGASCPSRQRPWMVRWPSPRLRATFSCSRSISCTTSGSTLAIDCAGSGFPGRGAGARGRCAPARAHRRRCTGKFTTAAPESPRRRPSR